MTELTTWPKAADTALATSRIRTSGFSRKAPSSRRASKRRGGAGSLGPTRLRRAAASSTLRPAPELPTSASTASAGAAQNGWEAIAPIVAGPREEDWPTACRAPTRSPASPPAACPRAGSSTVTYSPGLTPQASCGASTNSPSHPEGPAPAARRARIQAVDPSGLTVTRVITVRPSLTRQGPIASMVTVPAARSTATTVPEWRVAAPWAHPGPARPGCTRPTVDAVHQACRSSWRTPPWILDRARRVPALDRPAQRKSALLHARAGAAAPQVWQELPSPCPSAYPAEAANGLRTPDARGISLAR